MAKSKNISHSSLLSKNHKSKDKTQQKEKPHWLSRYSASAKNLSEIIKLVFLIIPLILLVILLTANFIESQQSKTYVVDSVLIPETIEKQNKGIKPVLIEKLMSELNKKSTETENQTTSAHRKEVHKASNNMNFSLPGLDGATFSDILKIIRIDPLKGKRIKIVFYQKNKELHASLNLGNYTYNTANANLAAGVKYHPEEDNDFLEATDKLIDKMSSFILSIGNEQHYLYYFCRKEVSQIVNRKIEDTLIKAAYQACEQIISQNKRGFTPHNSSSSFDKVISFMFEENKNKKNNRYEDIRKIVSASCGLEPKCNEALELKENQSALKKVTQEIKSYEAKIKTVSKDKVKKFQYKQEIRQQEQVALETEQRLSRLQPQQQLVTLNQKNIALTFPTLFRSFMQTLKIDTIFKPTTLEQEIKNIPEDVRKSLDKKSYEYEAEATRFFHNQEYEKAKENYIYAITIDDTNSWAWANIADLYLEQVTRCSSDNCPNVRIEDSIYALKKAISIKGDIGWMHVNLCIAQAINKNEKGNISNALSDCSQAKSLSPVQSNYYNKKYAWSLADFAKNRQNNNFALKSYRLALRENNIKNCTFLTIAKKMKALDPKKSAQYICEKYNSAQEFENGKSKCSITLAKLTEELKCQ